MKKLLFVTLIIGLFASAMAETISFTSTKANQAKVVQIMNADVASAKITSATDWEAVIDGVKVTYTIRRNISNQGNVTARYVGQIDPAKVVEYLSKATTSCRNSRQVIIMECDTFYDSPNYILFPIDAEKVLARLAKLPNREKSLKKEGLDYLIPVAEGHLVDDAERNFHQAIFNDPDGLSEIGYVRWQQEQALMRSRTYPAAIAYRDSLREVFGGPVICERNYCNSYEIHGAAVNELIMGTNAIGAMDHDLDGIATVYVAQHSYGVLGDSVLCMSLWGVDRDEATSLIRKARAKFDPSGQRIGWFFEDITQYNKRFFVMPLNERKFRSFVKSNWGFVSDYLKNRDHQYPVDSVESTFLGYCDNHRARGGNDKYLHWLELYFYQAATKSETFPLPKALAMKGIDTSGWDKEDWEKYLDRTNPGLNEQGKNLVDWYFSQVQQDPLFIATFAIDRELDSLRFN